MARLYDGIDFLWDSTSGDFALSPQGDIQDTSYDPLLAIAQEIYTRAKSDKGDWIETPLLGASLSEFIGEPNTKEIGISIKKRILSSMQVYGTLDISDIFIDVYPMSKTQIMITMSLSVLPTRSNKNSRVLKATFVYDYTENNVYVRN